tara:strand:- start:667 stop:4314 length:3648 start_codon:yes stop_codon:yes gene_type:complete
MATTQNTYTGNGSTTNYSFTFPYLAETDVKVKLGGVTQATSTYTFANATTISMNTAPGNGVALVIYRDTNNDTKKATFYPGSAIKAEDLNNDFDQILYVAQEVDNNAMSTLGDDPMQGNLQMGNNKLTGLATPTAGTDGTNKTYVDTTVDTKINTAMEGDVLAGTDLTKTASGGQVTLNHSVTGASSVDNSNGSVIQDLTINGRGHVTATGSVNLDGRYYTETELDAGQLDNRYYTETELNAGQLDNRYYTETEADARFYNLDSGEEIQSGETWSAADDKIATTKAIDARIIDLVDDVGGFVPVAHEQAFPDTNPDINGGAGTLLSVKQLNSSHTSNANGVITIANGSGSGSPNVFIVSAEPNTTYGAGFGMIVETTSVTHTYTFHRLVPKATEVTTVAGNISNINTVATNNTNINTVAGANSNITTVATNITNVNNVGGSIANVNTVASNLTSVNDFSDVYRIGSSDPTSHLHTGDLVFNTTSNELRVYNGSAWQGGVTATGNLLSKSGGEMTGNITFSGSQTVDGRDVSVDGTKLDGIAASANNYAISSDLLDQDDMASDSATKVPSQQSVKAYVDSQTTSSSSITVANEASDTNCFPVFVTNQRTGSLGPKSNTSLFFNSSTGQLNATIFNGSSVSVTGTVAANAFTGDGSALTNLPAGGNSFTAVANGAIANNKAVKLDSDGKVSEIKETLQDKTSPEIVGTNTGQAFYDNTANNSGDDVREGRQSTQVYDPDKGKIIVFWNHNNNNPFNCRVGTPNKATGVITWGDVIQVDSGRIKSPTAVYDTVNDKVIVMGDDDDDLVALVGTVASSGNSISFDSKVTCTNTGADDFNFTSSAFDPTTGRVIICYQDSSANTNGDRGSKIQIGRINSGTFAWHSGQTTNSNMISQDMFGSLCYIISHDIISIGDSKWLYVCSIQSDAPSGFTNLALYGKIINAASSDTAAPTYANTGAIAINTASTNQRGTYVQVQWNPTLEKILVAWRADPSGDDTNNNHFGMLCYFNTGKTDITINDATYNIGGSGFTDSKAQLTYDSGTGKFVYALEDFIGTRGRFLTCGGTGNNTLTVSDPGTFYNENPLDFGEHNKKDLIDITGGYLFSWYTNQLTNTGTLKTKTCIIATQAAQTNLTDANDYIGFADQAYTNGQNANILTYGNVVSTLSGLTIGSIYYVQGDGTVATSWDSSGLSSLTANTPVAGTALSTSKLLIRDPLIKT